MGRKTLSSMEQVNREKMSRVALTIILLIVWFSSAANAEGNWVLWECNRGYPGASNVTREACKFEVDSAYPTYEMCMEKCNANLKGPWIGSGDSKRYELPHGFMLVDKLPDGSPNVWFIYEAKCLPDTVDPRK